MKKNLIFFLTCLFFVFNAVAAPPKAPQKRTLCLDMIVKNESKVIEKCLASVKPLIDYWVIVDTGSTDGTQDVIRKFMQDIPGELHERPWVNFAHNRNEALKLAKDKGDFILLIDADEVLEYATDFTPLRLDKDIYTITIRQLGAADAMRPAIVNNHLDWNWVGEMHEFISTTQEKSRDHLKGVVNVCNRHNGARSEDPQKYLKDAQVLEKALERDPMNSRNVFYLAQSYFAAKHYELAEKNYEKRILMKDGEVQETFWAMYSLGMVKQEIRPLQEAVDAYMRAYQFFPMRAEPLHKMACLYRKMGNPFLGYLISNFALTLPYPAGHACVEYMVYDHSLLVEFANCALLAGRYEEGLEACERLLANQNLPTEMKGSVISNLDFAKKKLKEIDLETAHFRALQEKNAQERT